MSDFGTMLTGFAALATGLTGLQIVQQNSPTKTIDPKLKGKLEFRVIACKPVSAVTDEIRYTFDNGTQVFTMSSSGSRMLTIQVKFVGYDHGPGRDALYYLERLGNRLVWPSSLATLFDLDLALTNRGSFLDLSKVMSAEDRQWSVGIKDFMFLAVINENPDNPNDNPASWIEEVTFNSDTLDDEGGTPLVKQITGSVTRP